MTTQSKVIGLMVGVLLALTCGLAAAEDIKVKGTFAGDFAAGPDTNGDGIPSGVGTNEVQEIKKLGTFFVEFTAEILPPLPAPVLCSKNRLEFPFLYDQGIATQESSGDQLFFSYTSAVLCLNPNNGAFTFSGEAVYTGGTGEFAGASGSFTAKSKGQLFLDGSDSQRL
ncbi:MAG: hypothetical protein ACREQ3_05435 [Candidatus Binatia bacterium]